MLGVELGLLSSQDSTGEALLPVPLRRLLAGCISSLADQDRLPRAICISAAVSKRVNKQAEESKPDRSQDLL